MRMCTNYLYMAGELAIVIAFLENKLGRLGQVRASLDSTCRQ